MQSTSIKKIYSMLCSQRRLLDPTANVSVLSLHARERFTTEVSRYHASKTDPMND